MNSRKSYLRLLWVLSSVFLFSIIPGCSKKQKLENVLRVAVRDKFKSLDPIHAQDYYTNVLVSRSYEGLYRYHYLKRPYVAEPALADGMPTISKDGLTFTFKIKHGIKFQDDAAFPQGKGREVTASDFVYSFLRLADPKQVSDGWWIFDGKIKGLNEWRDLASKSGKVDYSLPIEGLKALDSHTLQIKLVTPFPQILYILTMNYTAVVAKEAVDHYGQEFSWHPVGTGPFVLSSLSPNQVVWSRNPNFHGQEYPSDGESSDKTNGLLSDAGKSLPFVDKIIDDIIIEDQPAWLNFVKGAHDYLMKIPKDNAGAVFGLDHKPNPEIEKKGMSIHVTPGLWFNYIAFNMEDPVVGGSKNKILRQAMNLAYDPTGAIEKFYLGLATRAHSPIPPAVFGFDPEYRHPYAGPNIEKAKALLASIGHPEGKGLPELTYDTTADSTYQQIGEYFKLQMAKIGIKVSINGVSWPELLARQKKKQFQICALSWVYDYPDVENAYQLAFGPNEAPGPNTMSYKNPEFDRLFKKMAVMRDGPDRLKIIAKLRDILAEDVPWIVTVNQAETRITHPWVHNFKTHQFEHGVEKYLRVDNLKRHEMIE